MGFRDKRVEEAIRVAMSEILQFEFKDPRLPLIISITGVSVGPDLQNASIYFTQMPDDETSIQETLEVLENGHGFLRHELAQKLDIRYTPQISFFYDNAVREAEKIEKLIQESRNTMNPEDDSEDPQGSTKE